MAKKGHAPAGWHFRGRLRGLDATLKNLRMFPIAIQRKVIRKAITKGSQPVAKAAKANVPTDSKQYKKSIGYKVWTGRKTGVVLAFIGPRLGFKTMFKGKPRDPRYYAHLVEFGRKAVRPKNKSVLFGLPPKGTKGNYSGILYAKGSRHWYGKQVAAARPQYPLRRAFRSTKSQVESEILFYLQQGIIDETAKLTISPP